MSSWPPHLPIAMTASRACAAVVADPGAGDGERGLERAGGQVGELGGGVVDALAVGEVAGGEPQQHPPVLHAQRVERLGVGHRRDRLGVGRRRRPPPPAAPPGRRTPGPGSTRASDRSAHATGRGGGRGGRRGRHSPRGRSAAASRCPRRRRRPPAARPGRRPASASRVRPARARSGSAVRPRTASSGSPYSPRCGERVARRRRVGEPSAGPGPLRLTGHPRGRAPRTWPPSAATPRRARAGPARSR